MTSLLFRPDSDEEILYLKSEPSFVIKKISVFCMWEDYDQRYQRQTVEVFDIANSQ